MMKSKFQIIVAYCVLTFKFVNGQVDICYQHIQQTLESTYAKGSGICFRFDTSKTTVKVDFFKKEASNNIPDLEKRTYLQLRDVGKLDKLCNGNYVTEVLYNYQFLFKGAPVYELITTCDRIKDSTYLKEMGKKIRRIYFKLNSKRFILPQKALEVARSLGMSNVQYQSLEDYYSGIGREKIKMFNRDVWILKDEHGKDKIRTIVLSAVNGKLLVEYVQPKTSPVISNVP